MSTRKILLAGSTCCALAVAAPVLAQNASYGSWQNGPQYSTPAEQQQTRELNEQAVQGTTQSSAVLNGEATAQNAQYDQQNAPPQDNGNYAPPANNNAPAQYDEGGQYGAQQSGDGGQQKGQEPAQYNPQQRYDQQEDEYQQQRQRYQDDRARYDHDIRAYDRAMYDWIYPAPVAYIYGERGPLERLYLIAEPSQQLFKAPVEGPGGRWVGRVRNVDIAPDGRPLRVEVALNRRVSVWVQPGDLRYDPQTRILFTDLDRDQLWEMPGATVESGTY